MNAASFRFRPASRLLSGKEFNAVFANRRVLRNGPFELYYKPIVPPPVVNAGVNENAPAEQAVQQQHTGQPVIGRLADTPVVSAVTVATMPRLGLVVPKKNAKRAVHRNLVKRLTREAFRHVCHQLPALDIVLRVARPLKSVDNGPLPNGSCREERKVWRRQIDELLLRLPQRPVG